MAPRAHARARSPDALARTTVPTRRTVRSLGHAAWSAFVTLACPHAAHAWPGIYNGGIGGAVDRADDIAAHPAGDLLVAGYSAGAAGYDLVVVRHGAVTGAPSPGWGGGAGAYRYAAAMPNVSIDGQRAFVATDAAGNVYVAGTAFGANQDFVLIKLTPAGQPSASWPDNDGAGPNAVGVRRWSYSQLTDDVVRGLAVRPDGVVYITGRSGLPNTPATTNYTTVGFGATGSVIMRAVYDGPGHAADDPHDIALDAAGYVYVTGRSAGTPTTGDDYATIKYAPNGGADRKSVV
jgi:hypothetical protein